MNPRAAQLRTLVIGDHPKAWEDAGFAVDADTTKIAGVTIALVGHDGGRGILAAAVDGIDHDIDALPFGPAGVTTSHAPAAPHAAAPSHANGVTDFDHLVAMSPDMDRTVTALVDAGLDHRRSRTFTTPGGTRRQAFFWLGDVILELVGDDVGHGEGPATLWGVALTCADLDVTAERLGSRLGPVKPAVQSGREIATLHTRELDLSVPIALMSPHPAGS